MAGQQQTEPAPVSDKRALVEAVIASTVGTTIEWYDFFLYGTAAALVFPKLFFPEQSDVPSARSSLSSPSRPGLSPGRLVGSSSATWATAWAASPRWWRRCCLMGLSTLLDRPVADVCQHSASTAALLLTLLRVIQGIGVGGEWGGAVLLALESGHRGKRGFYASWPQAGVPLGLLASTGVFALVALARAGAGVLGLGLAAAVPPFRSADRGRAC